MRNRFSSIILFSFLTILSAVSCTQKPQVSSAELSDGTSVTWTPAEPRIGDLVTLTAYMPMTPSVSEKKAESAAPGMQTLMHAAVTAADLRLAPVFTEYNSRTAAAQWSFRIDRTGAWNIEISAPDQSQAADSDGQKPLITRLWITESELGDNTSPVKFDPQYLWTGKGKMEKLPSPPAGQAQGAYLQPQNGLTQPLGTKQSSGANGGPSR